MIAVSGHKRSKLSLQGAYKWNGKGQTYLLNIKHQNDVKPALNRLYEG
jgi:hypothetical protein